MLQNIKSLLIGLSRDERSQSAAIDYGLSLAQQAQAHASILTLSPKVTVTHAFVSQVADRLIEEENTRLLGLAQTLADQARQEALSQGIACTAEVVQEHYPALSTSFAKRARIHDLTVFDAETDTLSLNRGLLEEGLFNGGAPMIVVSPGVTRYSANRVLISWDGSAKAARAVSDALPFLRAAQQVEILSISGEKDLSKSVKGAELAPHLTRHGINCAVKETAATDGDIGETLRTQAGYFRADLIVMGAFVHSRLRQMVLGGVTQSMLKSSKVPLFLSY
ncbi:universal stress protein UspA [Microvirga sp. KLBC 81]|uniref:universal stress protein n=1 Tax=Microvirga sp. KLBC 81 TaxID=1862707 RepID=UPI000D50B7A3|nr:universal stress protein [Microvirga sp. KLBC 81]PVE23368.1 universal stress protein UspA [Microvirga sp. KLBC 81]